MTPPNRKRFDQAIAMDPHHIDSSHSDEFQGSANSPSDESSHGQLGGGRQPRKKASIVVLDSSPLSLLALAGVLHSQGYSCICARDGEAAIQALEMGVQDMLVCDVGNDAAAALATLESMRAVAGHEQMPAVLIAESRWAGLEKKAEKMKQATRCLFKPIDPNSLIAVVDQVLWMPSLVANHRRRGSSPNRPGWITL